MTSAARTALLSASFAALDATVANFRLHATVKAMGDHFIPMLTVRGAKGRMIGSYTPKGTRLDTATFTNKLCAQIAADQMAFKVAKLRPEMFAVA